MVIAAALPGSIGSDHHDESSFQQLRRYSSPGLKADEDFVPVACGPHERLSAGLGNY